MLVLLGVAAAANLGRYRLKRRNATMRDQLQGQVVATLTPIRKTDEAFANA